MNKASLITAILNGDTKALVRNKLSHSPIAQALTADEAVKKELLAISRRINFSDPKPTWTREERDKYISVLRNSSAYQSDPESAEAYIQDVIINRL